MTEPHTTYDFADDLLSRLRDDYAICERNGRVTDAVLFIYHRQLLEESGTTFDPKNENMVAKLRRQCLNYLDNHGYALTTAHRGNTKRKPRAKDKSLKLISILCAERKLRLNDQAPRIPIRSRYASHTPEPDTGSVSSPSEVVPAEDIVRLYSLIANDESYNEVVIPLRWDSRTGAALYLLGRSWVTDLVTEATDKQCFFATLVPRDMRTDVDGLDVVEAGLSIGIGTDSEAARQVFTDWDEAWQWYRRLTEGWMTHEFTYVHNNAIPQGCPESLRRFFEDKDPLLDDDSWHLTPEEEREYEEFLDKLHRNA
ncbi:hypothetical protein BISA_1642 [Bifidobacterium saguini DSM 23967]|uniref:Uncharacterized protein n=2 Tax=Bifidobacterium saguini TaxID=762210 RepID=A0A087DE70_9BIFI|nr:hypothetical protein [Bifidobacterium saguini]KFI93820.1 hypothetical protein BISA_1642 [Bifidobacterium saguini DSM 23967]QTB91560.1 hypothetical protein BSD967_03875 [Bifidobacterium saguini]